MSSVGFVGVRRQALAATATDALHDSRSWRALPVAAQLYVVIVVAAGTWEAVTFFPRTATQPLLFAILLAFSCLTSSWKVNLLSPAIGATLSVSYAANLMALLLLGPQPAMIIAVAGAWAQCTFKSKRRNPFYRTAFSMAAEAITMQMTGWAYLALGGAARPLSLADLPLPLVGAIAAYFIVNSSLMAGAMGLSTRRPAWEIWHEKFLWSAPAFIVAGTAGAIAAAMVDRGMVWLAILMLSPVYLTYRSYHVFLGRIQDQHRRIEKERRHHAETQTLHQEAVATLEAMKRAERALADQHEHLSVTLRSIGDGVITTDREGTILMINRAAEALTGWTERDAVGRPLMMIFRNLDGQTRQRHDNSLARLTADPDKPHRTRHSVLVDRDLTERPIEESAAVLRDACGGTIGMVVVFRDISDALKAQEERARADKLSSLGLLAGGIAHDFNNILMSIMGSVSMARAMMPQSDPAADVLRDGVHACERARQLTWQLLTFSKGGVPIKRTVAIPGLLKEFAGVSLRDSNVSCDLEIAPDLWPVRADEGQLLRVFDNVIINAQQAMPQGGVIAIRAQNVIEPAERVEHGLRVDIGPYVRISIIDSGIGIPPEHLCSIFDPYFSTKQDGRGLGLAMAYSIVKNHGGYISVESTPRRGTTVHVNLPAMLTREAQTSQSVQAPGSDLSGTGRILFMDDEAAVRTLVVNMLEFLGYDAEAASDGAAAIEQYKRALAFGRPFDVVLLDYVVPGGMDGAEAAVELARIDPAVNAILVSGYVQHPVMTEFRARGFKAVLVKPITLEELNRALHSVFPSRMSTVH